MPSVQQLLERLAQADPGAPCVVAFDGDGTLWSGDIGEDVFRYAVSNQLIRAEALAPLQQLAAEHRIEPLPEPNQQALRLFEAFEAEQLPELAACEFMAWCYAGWEPAALAEQIRAALREVNLASRYFEPALGVADWARARGHRTVVVSASPHPVVAEAVEPLGFKPEQIAAGLPVINEQHRYDSTLSYPLPYANTKVTALRTLAGDAPILAALGDNVFDIEMLSTAAVAVAVRPKPRLKARLSELADCFQLA